MHMILRTVAALVLVVLLQAGRCGAAAQIDWDAIPERTRVELHRAQQLMNENRFEEAIARLQKFKERGERYQHFLIDFNIGTAYGMMGRYGSAIEHLEQAVAREVGYAPLWLNLGKLYYQEKIFDKSGAALEKGFGCDLQKDPEVLFMAMAAWYQAGDLPGVIRLGEELVTTYRRDTFEIVSLLANAYITTENYAGAVAMLTRLIERNPDNARLWKLVTQAYFKNQEYEKAVVAYETYGYLKPLSREEILIMGDLFTMIGVPRRAAQYYERALHRGGTAEEFEKMSVAYYAAYEFDQAIESIDRALGERENHERLLLKAQLYYLQDKFSTARELYARAGTLMCKDGHEWLMAGYCAMRDGDLEIARELLTRATAFPTQRQEATAMLNMLMPAQEREEMLAAMREAEKTLAH